MRVVTAATRLSAIGGLERAQLEECRQLRLRGHTIDLLYLESGDMADDWAQVADRRVRVGGYSLHRRAAVRATRGVAQAVAAIHALRPDVLYFHNHRHAFAMGLAGPPMVCHMHLPPPPTGSRQDAVGLRRVGSFLAVSRFTASQWSEHLAVEIERFSVVPNVIDFSRFASADATHRAAVREELGLPVDRFLVLYAGRIDPEKGVDVALEAMRTLPASEYHLAVVGDPNPGSFDGDAAAANAYAHDLRSRFRDVPATWMPRRKDVSRLLAAADVVVLPSRFADPLPLIVLETLASGTPVVASAVGGIPEMLTGPFAAGLVPRDDPATLAERVRSFRNWRSERPDLGHMARAHVEANYSLPQMGERIEEALDRAVASRRTGLAAFPRRNGRFPAPTSL